MKRSIAAASAETWNQKNLPPGAQHFEAAPGEVLKELPSAALRAARQNRGILILSLAILGALGAYWYFSQEE